MTHYRRGDALDTGEGTLPAVSPRVNLSLIAVAAIIAAAMILGTPGDDEPMCVSEFAVADRCEP